jgi:hypothetical protein
MCKRQLLIENNSLRGYIGVTMHSLSKTHDNLGVYKNPFKIDCGGKMCGKKLGFESCASVNY